MNTEHKGSGDESARKVALSKRLEDFGWGVLLITVGTICQSGLTARGSRSLVNTALGRLTVHQPAPAGTVAVAALLSAVPGGWISSSPTPESRAAPAAASQAAAPAPA